MSTLVRELARWALCARLAGVTIRVGVVPVLDIVEEPHMESITRQTLSVAEAAEVLGISRAHAYDCVRSGELPSITLGRRVVIPLRALDELLDGRAPSTRD